jgi:RNA polymerase sigma-70 factor, ECF subfamily
MTQHPDITQLLRDWKCGGERAADGVFDALMPQLRRIASCCFSRERAGHTLQPTALVNEAFFRLAASKEIDWQDRGHFLALAGRVMRRCLIDHARGKPALNFLPMEGLPERLFADQDPSEMATILDKLLDELQRESPRQRSVVELRFFLGLTDAEGAEALNLTLHTFQREWYRARKWLFERLTSTP